MKKIGLPILYVCVLKPFKQWNFDKLQVFWASFSTTKLSFFNGSKSKSGFLGEFFHNKVIVFQWKQIKILNFCFASFDSLKAVTGCF